MDWLEPLRKDTERIRQETIKIREETIKIREETIKIREETEKLREQNRILKRITEEQRLKKIVKEIILEKKIILEIEKQMSKNLITLDEHNKRVRQAMRIFLDTADVNIIRPAYETGLIDGVTTNPTLILKSGRQLKDVIEEISTSFPNLRSISAEVVGNTTEMLTQGAEFSKIRNVTIKVPCTVEGLKVCQILSGEGVSVNVTLVFSVAQAILAAKAGATYISPFVGRLEDQSFDGLSLIKNIREVYDHNNIQTQILAASIRDVRQVEQCSKYGADVVTIPPVVFWAMFKNVLTEKGLEQFNKDWNEVLSQS